MKTILSIYLILFWQPILINLDSTPELFTVDKLGNCYIYYNYELKKHSKKGILLSKYNNIKSGKLYSIDISDPLHILLFYKDFNQIEFLDNKLNKKGAQIFLDELGLNSVNVVCKSKAMAVWIHDDYENKLIQYSITQKKILHVINVENFSNTLTDISYMLEYGDKLYLNQNNEAIWVFDLYGSFEKKINLKIEYDFQVSNNNLMYNRNDSVYIYNFSTEKSKCIYEKMNAKIISAKISNDYLYLLKKNHISINSLNAQ